MTLRTKIASALTIITVAAFAGHAMAAAGQTPLSQCYDLVISTCNQGNHPVSCAENGMDQCDDQYGNAIGGGALNLRAPGRTGPKVGLLLPAVQQ